MRFVSCGFARAFLLATLVIASRAAADDARTWDASAALEASRPPAGLRLVWADAGIDPASTLDQLERAGFHVAVSLPPHVYYVRDEGTASVLPAGCAFRDAGPAHSANMAGELDLDPFQGREDALPPATPGAGMLAARRAHASGIINGLPYGARWTDTSEFMIGRVAVSILFPESDGSLDLNHYDWTPALRDSVVRAAVRGLAGWTAVAAQRGVPLSFAIEVHPGLATKYEPIDRAAGEEENWIADVLMGFAGYRSDALTLCYDVANQARGRLGAQWSVLLFAVQDDTDSDGAFADGAISHAKLGGPYFVTPINNLNTTSASLDYYIRHEIAHSFWALDEHFPSTGWWACQLTTGYFNQPNYNSVVPAPGYCGVRRGCLMYANQPDSLCDYTQYQIGWVDRDHNGSLDLFETRATARPDSSEYRAVAGPPITLRGIALEGGLWNQNPYHFFSGDTISAATIDSVLYRLVGDPWSKATPLDGAFDSGRELFMATIPPLPPGNYVVEWQAWNTNGLPSQETGTTFLSLRASTAPANAGGGQPTSARLRLRYGPSPSRGPVRFTLEAEPGGSGWATLHDVQGREVARRRIVVPSSGTEAWTWGPRVTGGAALPSGLYFLSIEVDGAALKRRLVISH